MCLIFMCLVCVHQPSINYCIRQLTKKSRTNFSLNICFANFLWLCGYDMVLCSSSAITQTGQDAGSTIMWERADRRQSEPAITKFFYSLCFDEVSVHMFLHLRCLGSPNVIVDIASHCITHKKNQHWAVLAKYPFLPLPLPQLKGLKFPWGGVSVRPTNLMKCMRLTWNFQRGGLSFTGEVWIFSGTTHLYKITCRVIVHPQGRLHECSSV